MTNGPEAPEAECSTDEGNKESEARRKLADYRAQIAEDEASGRLTFFAAESCRAVANAIEDLYDSLDQALAQPEEATEAGTEDHDGSGAGHPEGVEVEGDEVESSEAVGTPTRYPLGRRAKYAYFIPADASGERT